MFDRKYSTLDEILEAANDGLKKLIVDFEKLETKIAKINEVFQSGAMDRGKFYDSTFTQVYEALTDFALYLKKYDYLDTLVENIEKETQEKLNNLVLACDKSLSRVMSHSYFQDSDNYRKEKEKYDELLAKCSTIRDELIPSPRPGLK